MPNSKTLFAELVSQIDLPESKEEIESIVFRLLENTSNLSRADILMDKASEMKAKDFESIIQRINQCEPIQYILNEEYFYGRKFYVNPSVLIPRPETEELVGEVLALVKDKHNLKIFDIGTGSGCIAITLAEEFSDANVFATDISDEALIVAKKNANSLNVKIDFLKHNLLLEDLAENEIDLIVSNPPYISPEEKSNMKSNVLSHEPHLALFAPSTDPLIFYRRIAQNAQKKLKTGGVVAVEINEYASREIAEIFLRAGLKEIQIKKDISGKPRVITALKSMTPIVLLPGALGSKNQLDSLAALLKNKNREVYSLNFSGHGGKPFSSAGFGIEVFANDVVEFLEQNGLTQVDLFGYSMGGYVALWVALHNPDRVNRIVTLGTKFDWNPEAAEKEVKKLNPAKVIEKVPAFARLLETRHFPTDWKELMSQTASMMTDLGSNPLLTANTLKSILHPVNILLGDNDDMADRHCSMQVASQLPHGKFKLLPETFHPIEKIKLELLLEFLS